MKSKTFTIGKYQAVVSIREGSGNLPPIEKPLNKTPYLTYRSSSVGGLSNIPSHKKRIKNRNNRKRRHKK